MSAQMIVQGTLKSDGTLELEQKPKLSPGRVRVTVEPWRNPAAPPVSGGGGLIVREPEQHQ